MSDLFKASMSGARDLDRALAKLPGTFGARAVEGGMRKGLKIMAEDARERAPEDEGDLRGSIRVRKPSKQQRAKGAGHMRLSVGKPAGWRAHFAEFGTRHHAAQPFMRPAFDARAGDAIKALAEHMAKQLKSATRALSGGVLNRRGRRRFR